MNPRLAKQLTYGFFYLALIILIIAAAYYIRLKPAPSCLDERQNQGETGTDCGGPCAPCEIARLKPFEAIWLKSLPAEGNQSIIIAEVKNSNSGWGADDFTYTFDLYDENENKITGFTGRSFIYANEVKYLSAVLVQAKSSEVGKIELSFDNIHWQTDDKFPKPKIQARDIKTESSQPISISGAIKNENPYPLSQVNIFGFLTNAYGVRFAVSKTEINNLPAFQEQTFKIIFPQRVQWKDIEPDLTRIFVEAKR